MGFIKVFIFLPSKGKFLQAFSNNEQLKAQADQVWRQLDVWSIVLLIVTLFIGITLAAYYYTMYNERPGRRYTFKHWCLFASIAFVITFISTIFIEYLGINTNLKTGIASLYWLCAINNALYCFVVYFITSFIWCNYLPTNAYRFLKF